MPIEEDEMLYFRGQPLDCSPQAFGMLRVSDDALSNPIELRRRFAEDGYLYLPNLLNGDDLLAARQIILDRLAHLGYLDPNYPPSAGVAKPGFNQTFMPELAKDNSALIKVLYSGPMMAFYDRFFGGPTRHFDYTWFRAKTAGPETADAAALRHRLYGTRHQKPVYQLDTVWRCANDDGRLDDLGKLTSSRSSKSNLWAIRCGFLLH